MTSAQVVETSVNVTLNSPSKDYTHPDDSTSLSYDMTPGFKPFTKLIFLKFHKFQPRYSYKVYSYKVRHPWPEKCMCRPTCYIEAGLSIEAGYCKSSGGCESSSHQLNDRFDCHSCLLSQGHILLKALLKA